MNENMNNQNENAEEVIHEAEEFEDVWGDCNNTEAENNEAENIKEENIMNNQNTQNQNNVNENNINVNCMTNDELKQLKKKINAEQAARTPSWKKWVKRIALGLGIAGGVAGIGYGVKKIVDNKKTDVDNCCGNSVDIDTEAAKWGVDIA
jgi:hypothetical protein